MPVIERRDLPARHDFQKMKYGYALSTQPLIDNAALAPRMLYFYLEKDVLMYRRVGTHGQIEATFLNEIALEDHAQAIKEAVRLNKPFTAEQSKAIFLLTANEHYGMGHYLNALIPQLTDSPIIVRAIRDVQTYVNAHLLKDRYGIDENILQERITQCESFITTINNARAQTWEEGKTTMQNYYEAARLEVRAGRLTSYLKSTLNETYENLSGISTQRHWRTDADMRSIDDPLTAYHYVEVKTVLERIQQILAQAQAQAQAYPVDNKVTDTIQLITDYLRTLTGEIKLRYKDYLPISGIVLHKRLSKLQELAILVEKYLQAAPQAPAADNIMYECPISFLLMRDPVIVVTSARPDQWNRYERTNIQRHFNTGKMYDPLTRLEATGELIPDVELRQNIERYARSKDYFLSELQLKMSMSEIYDVKSGVWGSNLMDLYARVNQPPAPQEMRAVAAPANA